MYKRRHKSSGLRSSQSSTPSDGSDIVAPNQTSLIVQTSRISDETDALPKSVMAVLYEDESEDTDSFGFARPSTSLMNSFKKKTQSTPQKNPQRVLRDSNVSNTQQAKASSQNRCFFLSTLRACGAEEIYGEGSFRLTEDQTMFCRKINNKLISDNSTEEFLDSLVKYWDDGDNLKKLLMLTQTSQDCEIARGPVQEPMLRLLLMTDCLQSGLMEKLAKKINTIVSESCDEKEDALLISGILRQVRCLSRVSSKPHFATMLFDIFHIASTSIAREIIFLIPELVTEEERPDVAQRLVDALQDGRDLTPFIIDSLSNLCLSDALERQVREQILSKLSRYPLHFLPSLVHFVLYKVEPSSASHVVCSLRQNLPFSTTHLQSLSLSCTGRKRTEADQLILKIVDQIKKSLMMSKLLVDAWLKEICNCALGDARPIDLLILIVIYGYVIGRKTHVLSAVRNRIRAGVFTENLLTETYKVLSPAMKENHREVLDFSSALLKSQETFIADIGIALLCETFTACGQFRRQDVISDIVMLLNTGDSATVRNAITLLMRMREKDRTALDPHATMLMSGLKVLPKMEFTHARQLTDVIASIVMKPSEENSGLIEEFVIFIRKQLSSWQPDAQHRGTIAAITTAKHACLNAADPEFYEKFELNLLLKMSSRGQKGFFLDELAIMLMDDVSPRPVYLSSWVDRVFSYLQEKYFVSDIDLECDNFPMSLQFSIENSGNLVLPIVAFFLKPQDEYLDIWSLPAALRLLWCSEKDMSRISGILCSSVILPDNSVFEKFLQYSPSDQKLIMDCLFVCANYFIECINALSTQKTSEKLVIRLKQLIEVRKLIVQHIESIPDYTPPPCQFHLPVQKIVVKKPAESKSTRGRKRKADGANADVPATQLDASVIPGTSAAAPADAIAQQTSSLSTTDLSHYSGHFRELSCKAYRLLRMELKLNPTKVFKKKKMSDLIVADVSWSYRPEDKPELGPLDTLFLLQDYVIKSDALLRERPCFLQRKTVGLLLESMTASMFINGCVKLLPKFCLKMDVASRYCTDLLEANDGIWDAPGCFPEGSREIKLCFCTLLSIICDIVNWKGLDGPQYQKILHETMLILAQKSARTTSQSVSSLAFEAAQYLAGFVDSVPLLWGGVCLTRAVHGCLKHSGSKDFSLVGTVCEKLLKRPWFTIKGSADCGSTYNQHVDALVRLYLSCTLDRLGTVLNAAQIGADEVPELVGKDTSLPSFPALNKGNFPVMYRAMCEALVAATSEELGRRIGDDESVIHLWTDVIRTLVLLVDISKAHTSRLVLSALLKRSQVILQQFLSKGLPILETALRIKSEEVLSLLKSLQGVTRFFNSVCCHSQMTADGVMAAHVPQIRALCERLTLEMKGVLIVNKIPMDCFTIAALKNKDLRGNEIPAEPTVTSDDESEIPEEVEEETSNLDLTSYSD